MTPLSHNPGVQKYFVLKPVTFSLSICFISLIVQDLIVLVPSRSLRSLFHLAASVEAQRLRIRGLGTELDHGGNLVPRGIREFYLVPRLFNLPTLVPVPSSIRLTFDFDNRGRLSQSGTRIPGPCLVVEQICAPHVSLLRPSAMNFDHDSYCSTLKHTVLEIVLHQRSKPFQSI